MLKQVVLIVTPGLKELIIKTSSCRLEFPETGLIYWVVYMGANYIIEHIVIKFNIWVIY
jgi:hypothetical protein